MSRTIKEHRIEATTYGLFAGIGIGMVIAVGLLMWFFISAETELGVLISRENWTTFISMTLGFGLPLFFVCTGLEMWKRKKLR